MCFEIIHMEAVYLAFPLWNFVGGYALSHARDWVDILYRPGL